MKYLVIGDGNVAKHLSHILSKFEFNFENWSRNLHKNKTINSDKNTDDLKNKISSANIIFLAISDDSLDTFYSEYKYSFKEKLCFHFSGSFYHKEIFGVHPLQTFSKLVYSIEEYKKIPLIIDFSKNKFKEYFPFIKNNIIQIRPHQKTQYHAYCSMAGNFPQILWRSIFNDLTKLGLNKKDLAPYLYKSFENALNSDDFVTGPIARGDSLTIEKHKASLANTKYQDLYNAYLNFYNSDLHSKELDSNDLYSYDSLNPNQFGFEEKYEG